MNFMNQMNPNYVCSRFLIEKQAAIWRIEILLLYLAKNHAATAFERGWNGGVCMVRFEFNRLNTLKEEPILWVYLVDVS
jgi:hypothetical protein